MLTRGNVTTDVTDPNAYFYEHGANCTNGTKWNATTHTCEARKEVWKPYPEQGMATFLIFPQKESGQDQIILGAPFLDDYYQVYNLEKAKVGLVPSVEINDEGNYASSKPENVHDSDRTIIIAISIIGLVFAAIFRNGVYSPCYASTYDRINNIGKPGYSSLEGGEREGDEEDEWGDD